MKFLVVSARTTVCAIALEHVVETCRPLPLTEVSWRPLAFVVGATRMRGTVAIVVDLGLLLGSSIPASWQRFVAIRLGERQVALAVEKVFGVEELEAVGELPPLLQSVDTTFVEGIRIRDGELLTILSLSRMIPPDVWDALS